MSSKAITALLTDETAAEDRVFPVFIPQRFEGQLPAITFQQIGGTPVESTNGGSTTQDTLWQITAIGATYAQAHDLINQVRVALHGYSGTAGGVTVQHILVESGSMRDIPYVDGDMEQLERYGKSIDFRIMYEDTAPSN
jgi:hypothetical protein